MALCNGMKKSGELDLILHTEYINYMWWLLIMGGPCLFSLVTYAIFCYCFLWGQYPTVLESLVLALWSRIRLRELSGDLGRCQGLKQVCLHARPLHNFSELPLAYAFVKWLQNSSFEEEKVLLSSLGEWKWKWMNFELKSQWPPECFQVSWECLLFIHHCHKDKLSSLFF